jgi:hypothetical protein
MENITFIELPSSDDPLKISSINDPRPVIASKGIPIFSGEMAFSDHKRAKSNTFDSIWIQFVC